MSAKTPLLPEENDILIKRYTPLIKKYVGKFARYNKFLPLEDRRQTAARGVCEAGRDHGKDATPLQVEDGIRTALLRELREHQKSLPREPRPCCGSTALKSCPCEKQAMQKGSHENGFGNGNPKLVSIDDNDCYRKAAEAIPADTSDKETEIWLEMIRKAETEMPEEMRKVYHDKFVENKSMAKIGEETGRTRKVVERVVGEIKDYLTENAPKFEAVSRSDYAETSKSALMVVPCPEPPADRHLVGISKLTTCMYCHSSEHLSDGHRSPIEKKKLKRQTSKARKRVVKEIPAYLHEESHEEVGVLCGVGEDD